MGVYGPLLNHTHTIREGRSKANSMVTGASWSVKIMTVNYVHERGHFNRSFDIYFIGHFPLNHPVSQILRISVKNLVMGFT